MGEFDHIRSVIRAEIRRRKDLNQKVVAARVSKSQSLISEVLSGKKSGSMQLWTDIAAACDRTLKEILSGFPAIRPSAGKIVELHLSHIPKFKNQGAAEEINRKLLEIERIDPSKMQYILGVIDTTLDQLQSHPDEHPGDDEGGIGGGEDSPPDKRLISSQGA